MFFKCKLLGDMKLVIEKKHPDCNTSKENESEDANCPLCKKRVWGGDKGVGCDRCRAWYHAECLYLSDEEYFSLSESNEDWFCDCCLTIKANNLNWGDLNGEENILHEINKTYEECIKWSKNIFLLPRGKSGKDFINELTRLITLFTDKTKWERLALPLVHIFFPLMLQKPSKTSKAKDHTKYLSARLEKWKAGDLKSLIAEGKEIQKRLEKSHKKQRESNEKAFCRLMFEGKVGQAVKFINNEDTVVGVHKLTVEIKQILQDKHPKGEDLPEVQQTRVQQMYFYQKLMMFLCSQ